jgi:hypothetical protein
MLVLPEEGEPELTSNANDENQILSYFHCSKCIAELPNGTSPRDWAQLEVGMTPLGIQVWCKRHDLNVYHFDLTTISKGVA